jgi:hypothetical protein
LVKTEFKSTLYATDGKHDGGKFIQRNANWSMDSAAAKESKKESKRLDTETIPKENANILLMY